MTTQVHVAVSGNKQVVVSCTNGHDGKVSKTLMQPGAHHIFLIHGEAKIEAKEVGDFINTPSLPLVRPLVEDENQGDLIKGVSETADDGIAGNG